jgi:hypothetical protein
MCRLFATISLNYPLLRAVAGPPPQDDGQELPAAAQNNHPMSPQAPLENPLRDAIKKLTRQEDIVAVAFILVAALFLVGMTIALGSTFLSPTRDSLIHDLFPYWALLLFVVVFCVIWLTRRR